MKKNINNYESLKQDALKYIWYPFTQMKDFVNEDLVIIEKGEANTLIDIDGNKYIDGISSLWTNVHGHRKKKLDLAVKHQLDKICHSTMLGISNVTAIECAKKLIQIAPENLNRVFFSDSGSTATEIALKIAFQYQMQSNKKGSPQKTKYISFKNAYHGDTIGSISVGGIDIFHKKYGILLFQSIKTLSPYCYRCPIDKSHPSCKLECLNHLETLMQKQGHKVCALIIEPLVQGAAGILVQPPGYLKKIRELCTTYNITMITDEVAVGFGKTGKMFACEHDDVKPDIMAVAKGISGGYLPIAATLTTKEIYQGFLGKYEEFKTFFHGHTYTGNPLACAAAIANMELFEEENILKNLVSKINHFKKKLKEFKFLPHVGDIRQCGIMIGIELVKNKQTKQEYEPKEKIGHKVILESRKKGLIIRPLGNVVVIMPPLSITMKEIDRICNITFESIKKVTE